MQSSKAGVPWVLQLRSQHHGLIRPGDFWRRQCDVSEANEPIAGAVDAAKAVAAALQAAGQEFALGGALALGFWLEPARHPGCRCYVIYPAREAVHLCALLAADWLRNKRYRRT